MNRISSATVQRILDASDIVEVVSDFVSLKRRGANWVGLCPFHSDRSPSFYVSKSKGLCKCFSCGEGGSAVNFIMKHEQLSYIEALKYLARKYNIEVEERPMTDDERRAESERENMLAVNDFAMRFFEKTLLETPEGRDVGLSYFRHRGISDKMIELFHLGFAPDEKDRFFRTAIERGYSENYLIATGLSSRTEDGRVFDRFRGRVIYPVFSVSGKVVAFGGRTLRSDKNVAKYVNSPESVIYSKRFELYGLYQAKSAISKAEKCIIVEGYMDVISMHQAGICNVVASSGTALTVEQVRLINRFTQNVTLIYDSDAAGIKASMRGIELLLQAGMNIKVLLLPEGEDPDSYAQNHSSSEVEQYIADNEVDFITFMARILLRHGENDPIKRSNAITKIVKTIALIPSEITRSVYVQECSRILFVSEDILHREVGKYFNEYALKTRQERERGEGLTQVREIERVDARQAAQQQEEALGDHSAFMRKYELAVVRLAVKYGNYIFSVYDTDTKITSTTSVIDDIARALEINKIEFLNPDADHLFKSAQSVAHATWEEDLDRECHRLWAIRNEEFASGVEKIRAEATEVATIQNMERTLTAEVDERYQLGLMEFSSDYVARRLCSSPDDADRNLATELVSERHILSKVHTKYARIDTERDLIGDLIARAVNELKDATLYTRQLDIKAHMATVQHDINAVLSDMTLLRDIEEQRKTLASVIGDRVIAPRK